MRKTFETVGENVQVCRGFVSPHLAGAAGDEVSKVLAQQGYIEKLMGSNNGGVGNSDLEFAFGPSIPRWQTNWETRYLQYLRASSDTRNIGKLMLRARYFRRSHNFPLSVLGIHHNKSGTTFAPHFDVMPQIVDSLSLTEAILRVHADDHQVVNEVALNPGDKVRIDSSAVDPVERPVHSFSALEDTERASLVTKYRDAAFENRVNLGLTPSVDPDVAFAPRI